MGTFYSLNYFWDQNEQTREKLEWLDKNYPELHKKLKSLIGE